MNGKAPKGRHLNRNPFPCVQQPRRGDIYK